MTLTISRDEQSLDHSLKTLLAHHGYQNVLNHLVRVARSETVTSDGAWMPSIESLMALTPQEREPFLSAAVEDALPLYDADRARPQAERELTADLETGDFHDYGAEEFAEASGHGAEAQRNG